MLALISSGVSVSSTYDEAAENAVLAEMFPACMAGKSRPAGFSPGQYNFVARAVKGRRRNKLFLMASMAAVPLASARVSTPPAVKLGHQAKQAVNNIAKALRALATSNCCCCRSSGESGAVS